jgi:hypothetical protein
VRRAEHVARVPVSALVRLPAWARALGVLGLALGAALVGPLEPGGILATLALGVLALHGRSAAPRAPRLGAFRPAGAGELRAAVRALTEERLGPAALVDPSTVPGALLLGAVLGGPALAWAAGTLPVPAEHALVASGVAAAVLLGGTRRARVTPPVIALAHLAALARRVRADLDDPRRWAVSLVVHADVRGELQDARLRVVPGTSPRGLLRLDVVMAAQPRRTGWTVVPALLVVTREGSPADRALDERFPGTRVADAPRRVARQLALTELADAVAPVLDALATCPNESPPAASESRALAASA